MTAAQVCVREEQAGVCAATDVAGQLDGHLLARAFTGDDVEFNLSHMPLRRAPALRARVTLSR